MRKVLIIDEDAIALFIAEKLCKRVFPHYMVQLADCPYAGLAVLKARLPDMVIFAPRFDGPEKGDFFHNFQQLSPFFSKPVSLHLLTVLRRTADQFRAKAGGLIASLHFKPVTEQVIRNIGEAHEAFCANNFPL